MKHIDEARLESDLGYRAAYLMEFMGLDEGDITAIHDAAAHLAPKVSAVVDAVYDKLFSYDATKRHFVPRQHGYGGPVPEAISELTLDHEMIRFRKEHLARYLTTLVTRPYDGKMLGYLDMVGKIHTPRAGSDRLHVPLVQMNALMGFVADGLTNLLFSLGLDRETEVRTIRAFNKLLWVQNDLISRHYQDERQAAQAIAAAVA
jgi:hypothetical protein